MRGKVALEEHFAIRETLSDSAGFVPDYDWTEISARLLHVHHRRLREVDAGGIEVTIVALNAPAVQAVPDVRRTAELACRANDALADHVARRLDRAFVALPTGEPELASRERAAPAFQARTDPNFFKRTRHDNEISPDGQWRRNGRAL